MSFPVELGTNLSATNVVTKDISWISTVTGTLRDGSSIIDPVIIFEGDGTNFSTAQINYIHITAFNRYYYVTNIIAKHNRIFEVHGHVDVLMSFANQIKAQVAVVARQETEYNLMLDDGFFMAYEDPKLQTKVFSNATPFETQEFVLVVAGSQTGSPISTTSEQDDANDTIA